MEELRILALKRKIAFHDWNVAALKLLRAMFPPASYTGDR